MLVCSSEPSFFVVEFLNAFPNGAKHLALVYNGAKITSMVLNLQGFAKQYNSMIASTRKYYIKTRTLYENARCWWYAQKYIVCSLSVCQPISRFAATMLLKLKLNIYTNKYSNCY